MEFNQLLEEHFKTSRLKLLKAISNRAKTPENAEDVVQEAYCRALKYSASYDTTRSFDFWFSRIVYSCLMDFLREENGLSYSDNENQEEESIDCPSYPQHIMREIYELIDTKSVVQIEVLTLYFKHEYSATDISKVTMYSYAMCHKIISRFREELRQLYKDD